MQTQLDALWKNTREGQRADEILRKCVHCGFCNATCPTYQLLGDELDGPRGRIYQIKELLEGNKPTNETQLHLDRCLTCRNCETTCPSGVDYGELVDLGRTVTEQQLRRPLIDLLKRKTLLWLLPERHRFAFFYSLGRYLRFLAPRAIRKKITPKQATRSLSLSSHQRKVILLQGCVQNSMDAGINIDTQYVLNQLGVECQIVQGESCCGAVEHHLSAEDKSIRRIKYNIDRWWPFLEQGTEAIISNASACGLMVKDYGRLLANDLEYADKAKIISSKCKDLAELMETLDFPTAPSAQRVAVHPPCTLQHGQQLNGRLEKLMEKAGFKRVEFSEPHLCCGSAGTYSILQKELSNQLKQRKLSNIAQARPTVIVTANIGCQTHLAEEANVPVKHWISLLAEHLNP